MQFIGQRFFQGFEVIFWSMRIVFGVKSMSFRKFKKDQIEFESLLMGKEILEVRQNYFHLYFIPVFPIGKEYLMHGENGAKRKISETELEAVQNTFIPYRFPLLSFSLPILLIIGFLVYLAYSKISLEVVTNSQEQVASKYYSTLHTSLKNSKTNDLLIFDRSRLPASKADSEEEQWKFDNEVMKVGAWIKERNGDRFTLCFIENGEIDFVSQNKKDLNKIPDLPYINDNNMELTLDDLKATIPKDGSLYFHASEAVVPLGKREGYYSLNTIVKIRIPEPEIMMAQGLESNGKYILMNLANMGVDAQIKEIRTVYGNLDWKEKFPKDFPECSRENGCRIQLGATFKKDIFPIQVAKMKLTYGKGNWITYLIVLSNEDINLIEIYKN
jgi:hypothetical protein